MADTSPELFWHRKLPPINAELMGEHTVEAVSTRVSGRLAQGDRMWGTCYDSLIKATEERVHQELLRLGGDYAHIVRESIDIKHDMHTYEGWLHGQFDYEMYKKP